MYFRFMKKVLLLLGLSLFIGLLLPGCKAKHCAAFQDDMEGYKKKNGKKKRGRQEGLFPRNL